MLLASVASSSRVSPVDVLRWLNDYLLAWATVALAVVTVWGVLWTARRDAKERRRERRYARILRVQAALRLSVNQAAQLEHARSWRTRLVPAMAAGYVAMGTFTRSWEWGRTAELLTTLATSPPVRGAIEENEAFAFARSAYEIAGLLVELGPGVPPEVISRLQDTMAALQRPSWRRRWPWRKGTELEAYIAAVTDVHAELGRIIREERLEGSGRRPARQAKLNA